MTSGKTILAALSAALLGSMTMQAEALDLGKTLGGLTGTKTTTTTTTTTSPSLLSSVRLKPFYGNINPFYRDISAFWGNINPFYGDIGAFWGNINPFYGDIGAFWGNIQPFYGDIGAFYGDIGAFSGDLKAHYGNIGAFWGNISPFWGDINAFWGDIVAFDAGRLGTLDGKLEDFVARSAAFWGNAVTARTGQSFRDGFAAPLFRKYGMNLDDPASFYGKTSGQRAEFMLAWYDQLMEFSGVDHVDHWMKTVNWTPSITQQQGEGYDAVIGLIDFTVAGDSDIQSKLSYFNGVSNFSNGHGAGVASLMVAAHDGRGVMGIAPNASVVAYNPFDASGTTSFGDVRNGILSIAKHNPSVINMSLGVSGWTLHKDWNGVFSDKAVHDATKGMVFVLAAGNDGISQTENVVWNASTAPHLIIVGSVGPDGTISSFSNRPGSACLVADAGKSCKAPDMLMNRFVVAPGELILVSDDKGGVVRQSGTSLAAPIVSGTIALLHDRWPWLAKYPDATMEIIFRSAKDLGAPGIDPVYGHGLLDVTAAQSVLDFDRLQYYEYDEASLLGLVKTGKILPKARSAANVRAAGIKSSWEAMNAYFIVFEKTEKAERDFAIPLSTRLYGQTAADGQNQFQQFVYDRMVEWMRGGFAESPAAQRPTYMALSDAAVTLPPVEGWSMSFGYTTRQDGLFEAPTSEYSMRLADEENRYGFAFGYGAGAAALGYSKVFGLGADYRSESGVNPLLGFASGGAYASADVSLGSGFSLTAGFTASGDGLDLTDTYGRMGSQTVDASFDAYAADAFAVSVAYRADEAVTLRASYTQLSEENGLLGVVALQDDFAGATVTDGVTIAADVELGDGYAFGLSATAGQTRRSGNDLAVIDPLASTAFKAVVTKTGVFGAADRLRVSFGQPLTVQQGTMSYTQVGVVDRLTGELGPITQQFAVAGISRYEAELLYATPFLEGRGQFGAFGRAGIAQGANGTELEDYVGGVSLKLAF